MIQLAAMVFVGFLTWLIALSRQLALESRSAALLCFLIFADENLTLIVGAYVIRQGTWADIIACSAAWSLGGVLAGLVVLWRAGHGTRRQQVRK